MISSNGGLPAHRYTPQVTQRWPRGSEPASMENTVHLALLYTATHCKSSHMYILVGRETGLALCLQPGCDLPIVNRRLWSPSPKLHHFSTDVVADTLSDRLVTDRIAACTRSQGCLSTNHLGHCLHHKTWVVWQRISSISVAATLRGGCVRWVITPWRSRQMAMTMMHLIRMTHQNDRQMHLGYDTVCCCLRVLACCRLAVLLAIAQQADRQENLG